MLFFDVVFYSNGHFYPWLPGKTGITAYGLIFTALFGQEILRIPVEET